MTNLLTETKNKLAEMGVPTEEVSWVGSSDGKFALSWQEFEAIADVDYDAGFGAQEIAYDLVVVLKDGSYLARHEYDGSEWWEDRSRYGGPAKEADAKPFTRLKATQKEVGWVTIEDMNTSVSSVQPIQKEEMKQ